MLIVYGKSRSIRGENSPNAIFSTTNIRQTTLIANLGLRTEKSVAHRLSYVTADITLLNIESNTRFKC